MGNSGPAPSYRFFDHRQSLDVWCHAMDLEHRTSIRNRFAIHNALSSLYFLIRSKSAKADVALGSNIILAARLGLALGFDWERRHSNHVAAIVYMEGIVRPFRS